LFIKSVICFAPSNKYPIALYRIAVYAKAAANKARAANDICLSVQQEAGLFADRLYHFRMAVASIGYADTTGEIQVFCSILVIDVTTFAALSQNRGQVGPNGG